MIKFRILDMSALTGNLQQKMLKFSLDMDDIYDILIEHGTKPVSKRSYLRLQKATRYCGKAIGNACGVQLPSVRGRTRSLTALTQTIVGSCDGTRLG